MRLKFIGHVIVVVLLTVVVHVQPAAQISEDTELTVPARSRARSTAFNLEPSSALSVRLSQAPSISDGVIRVYVFEESGVLVAADDPEVDTELFTFTPSASGRFYVLVLNTNNSPAFMRIRSVPVRGTLPVAQNTAMVRVLFATNRQREATGGMPFGDEPADELSYGYCDVSIPRDHRMGELEAPSIWRLQFKQNPDKHIILLATAIDSADQFFSRVTDRVVQAERKEALVFVHGFNQTFDEAVKRTAQLAYDLALDGPAITFSWPSQGTLSPASYMKDQRNADLTAKLLEQFLLRVTRASPELTVHVIAHSMGNRVLARTLERMAANDLTATAPPLGEIAMMAPDIDAALFRQAAHEISSSAKRVTLYASSQDAALIAAQRVAGYPRAGEAGPAIMVVAGVETIDASAVETSSLGLGHSYYADNSTILSDLFSLIRGRRASERFGLEPMTAASGPYWRFRPAAR